MGKKLSEFHEKWVQTPTKQGVKGCLETGRVVHYGAGWLND